MNKNDQAISRANGLKAIIYANRLETILHIYKLPLDICNIIVKYVIDQDTIDNHLQEASANSHLKVVKFLHAHDADLTADDNLAIRWASHNGHLDVVKYILFHKNESDDNITYLDESFRWASMNGHFEIVQLLYSAGADITSNNHHSAKWASTLGYLKIVKFIHTNVADLNGWDAACWVILASRMPMALVYRSAIIWQLDGLLNLVS
jgi:ankyrin repeat protein